VLAEVGGHRPARADDERRFLEERPGDAVAECGGGVQGEHAAAGAAGTVVARAWGPGATRTLDGIRQRRSAPALPRPPRSRMPSVGSPTPSPPRPVRAGRLVRARIRWSSNAMRAPLPGVRNPIKSVRPSAAATSRSRRANVGCSERRIPAWGDRPDHAHVQQRNERGDDG
jgi:hypothetical protein